MNENKTTGVVYVATGKNFLDEALISINSVKKHMPDMSITLFTDLEELVASPPKCTDAVYKVDSVSRTCRDKIRPLADSPYEKTLFLDTDTYLCKPVYDLFEVLDRFDIALAHAPDRYQYKLPKLPACFTELNSGVIAFRKNDKVRKLLADWEKTFVRMLEDDTGSYRDQHSLRDALFRSDTKFLVLPPEYNFRTIGPGFAGKHCHVKIIHGRHADFGKLEKKLNRNQMTRVFLSNPYRIVTNEIVTYDSLIKSTLNIVFQNLPKSLKLKLTAIRNRFVKFFISPTSDR